MTGSFFLTKSKIRGQLLGFLFSNPKEKYYISELARQVGTSPGNVQRELRCFIDDGMIQREKKGNMVFYFLNDRHALFPEIRSLVQKTYGVEAQLSKLVENDKEIKLTLLYGSFARKEEKGESDIDLMIVSVGKIKVFYSELSKLEQFFNREINPTVYSPQEFKKKISNKDGFITHVLHDQHRILKGNLDDYRRKITRKSQK